MSAGNLSFGISGSGISGSSLPRLQSKSQQPARGGSSSRSARAPTKKTTLRSAAASGKPKQKSSRGGNYGQQRRHDPSEPISMERATVWSPEVEEAYRIQGSGWRSIHEYRRANGEPTRWENGMVKMTVHPKTGYFSTCCRLLLTFSMIF